MVWLPTADAINALPADLRTYVHDLQTMCDPAGLVAENALLRDTNLALQLTIVRLQSRDNA